MSIRGAWFVRAGKVADARCQGQHRRGLVLAALLWCGAAAAQLPPPEMALKGPVRTGSLIVKDSVFSALPLNRTYAELNAQEKAVLMAQYEPMPEGDEPPFPAQGLKPLAEALLRAQVKFRFRGKLTLLVTVDAEGNPREVVPMASSSPAMTDFAAKALMLTKFKPAVCGGRPCVMEFPFSMGFEFQ